MTTAPTSRLLRHAPASWWPNITRVQDTDGQRGVFVGNSEPIPGHTPRSWLGVLVLFDGDTEPVDVDPTDLVVITDPFAGIASRIPTRYAPGASGVPYDYPIPDQWYPVIYYPVGEAEPGEGPLWLVEPYPAERADGSDGQDPVENDGGAAVAVLRRSAAPRPRGTNRDGDWIVPGRARAEDSAYDARVRDQAELMAAWCEAWAIANALNYGLLDRLHLKHDDIEVLLAAERHALTGDSRFTGTIYELRWAPVGAEAIGSTTRVPARQLKRLRGGADRRLIEPDQTRTVTPDYGRDLSTAGLPWTQTLYRLTRAGATMLDSIRRQGDAGPRRCQVCGCTDQRACPGRCSWRSDADNVCTSCPITTEA